MPLHLSPLCSLQLLKQLIRLGIPMMLFHRHQGVKHIATLLHGPTRVVKDYAPKRLIANHPTDKMTIDDNSDENCS